MKSTLLTIFLLSFTSFLYAQNVVFADPNFEAALVADYVSINTNKDNAIQLSEARACEKLFVLNKSISDVSGIEEFINLKELNLYNNNLLSVDLSALVELEFLVLAKNQLNSILLPSTNTTLKAIILFDNQLTSLTLPDSLSSLQLISAANNQLSTIDLSTASILKNVYLQNNKLNNIIFPLFMVPPAEINIINCSHNELTSFSRGANYIDCGNNPISSLDYANFVGIRRLICDSCQLTNLQVSTIDSIDCSHNQLTALTTSSGVGQLDCSFNQIKNFSSSNPNFTDLNISHNQLERLEINDNTLDNIFNLDASSNDSLRCIQTNKSITNAQSSWTIPSQAIISAGCNGKWTSTTLLPSSNISIYPNPTSGNLQIELGQVYETVTIKVYNNVGQEVQTIYQEQTSQIMFDLPNSKGLYVVQIQTEQGQKSFSVLKE